MKKNYLLIGIAAVVSVAFAVLIAQNNKMATKKEAAEMALLETKLAAAEAKSAKSVVYKKSAARPASYQSPKMVSETQNAAKAKKGWSKAAKGAVIGGAGGAVAGAVINKRNRAAGAVIGGVIGAGGGYVIGRSMDKKDGRVQFN